MRFVDDKKFVEQLLDENLQKNFSENQEYVKAGDLINRDFLKIKFEDEEDEIVDEKHKVKEVRFYENMESNDNLTAILERSLVAYKYAGNQPMELNFYQNAIDN